MARLSKGPIGIFDSGFGGLSVFKEIEKILPAYDYVYLGDNARAPYGSRSFPTIYKYTWESVQFLFEEGCNLVIIACNTSSAKALRNIQQLNLKIVHPDKRVLGILRPTTEIIGEISISKAIGIMATEGTVTSNSYPIEIKKFFPEVQVFQQSCPMLVPLIEHLEYESEGAEYYIKRYVNELLEQSDAIDTILMACTHYPLIKDKIKEYLPDDIQLISQGQIVANSLRSYLDRHQNLNDASTKNGKRIFLTTGDVPVFKKQSRYFLGRDIEVEQVEIG